MKNENRELPELGGSYETQNGEIVKMVKIANAGTYYETLIDEKGINRYSRRCEDAGRVTGTAHDYSYEGNLKRPIKHVHLQLVETITTFRKQ